MKIAIPLSEGKLSMHFGHAEEFALVDADESAKHITRIERMAPPAHQPGILPLWLKGMNIDLVIVGGMGARARTLFEENGIQVRSSMECSGVDDLVSAYFRNALTDGGEPCSGGHGEGGCHQ